MKRKSLSLGGACLAIGLALGVSQLAVPAAASTLDATVQVDLSFSGLPDLGSGWVYEGWVIDNGTPVSTGRFTVDASGMPSQTSFTAQVSDASKVGAFVLTIEPEPDSDPGPSHVHILAGSFVGPNASLTAMHPAALGDDFSTAAGSYILAAPSAGEGGDYRNGIWWLDPAGPAPTLTLPTLPMGWTYEGWVVGPDGPVSTGRFTMASGTDSDGPGAAAGPNMTPPFPGEDFVSPARDLTSGYAAVITIEPEPDNSPAPFVFKPLIDMSIDDVGEKIPQDMTASTASFPTGTATLSVTATSGLKPLYLRLDFSGLDDLGPGWVYEGWVIDNGTPVSTGRFTVDASGTPSARRFMAMVSDPANVGPFVLTIEPDPDTDAGPSHVHILAGDFSGHTASLSASHPAALGSDFSTAAGSYILAAPSAGDGGDYRNGIWWLDPNGPAPTLSLPTLPMGWTYEGWVVGPDGPVSTGRFTMVAGADSDGPGAAAGPNMTPPFPGQDFVDPARDLTSGYAAVITIEPEPDNSPGPFTFKPLIDPMIEDVGEKVQQGMTASTASFPTGTAQILTPWYVIAGAHVQGYNGSMWRSILEANNFGSTQVQLDVDLLKGGRDNSAFASQSFLLDPGLSVRMDDVFQSVFGYTGSGALRVMAPTDMVKVGSETYNDAASGAFGENVHVMSMDDAIGYGQQALLIQLSSSSDMMTGRRTNLGFQNATGETIQVMAELYMGNGTDLGTMSFWLKPFEQMQVNNIFGQVTSQDVDVGYAKVWTTTQNAWFFTYASVVRNRGGAPLFVTP